MCAAGAAIRSCSDSGPSRRDTASGGDAAAADGACTTARAADPGTYVAPRGDGADAGVGVRALRGDARGLLPYPPTDSSDRDGDPRLGDRIEVAELVGDDACADGDVAAAAAAYELDTTRRIGDTP